MKFNSAFLSSLLIFSSSLLSISANAWAEEEPKPDRWFEIEVILFKQLNNKAALKEEFPDSLSETSLPKYQTSFDLFSSYLQPSLARIKQFAPLCGDKDEQHLFLDSLQSVNTPFPEQMQLIEQVAVFTMPDFSEPNALEASQAISDEGGTEEGITDEDNTGEDITDDKIVINSLTLQSEPSEPKVSQSLPVITDETPDDTMLEETAELVQFDIDLQEAALAKPIFSTQHICVITQNEFEHLFAEEQPTNFKLDAFGVDKLSTKLNAAGAHVQDTPYLIGEQSLLLKDISQRLRWSKEFKPLLHFGWRQIGITQSKAIPLKLFAGKHLAYEYQKTLVDYQLAVEAIKTKEQDLLEQLAQATELTTGDDLLPTEELNNDADELLANNDLKIKSEYKQQALNEFFAQIEDIKSGDLDNETIEATINNIAEQTLEEMLSINEVAITIDDQYLSMGDEPKEPLQPWFLDGFLKIHLDRYLYITADFNMFNQNNVKIQSGDEENNKTKLINFSQNRRVISGEIHYFDHPYIGMIVQIRRFDPTKPADEAVTQAIK